MFLGLPFPGLPFPHMVMYDELNRGLSYLGHQYKEGVVLAEIRTAGIPRI